ncbi:MAG: hypothetical protein ABSB91_04630 [Sedimentisphaerales bacterium]|jgi:hypothetical protein
MSNQLITAQKNAKDIYESLRITRPATKLDLKNYIRVFLGIDVPAQQICPEHNSPIDYLWHAFNSDFISAVSAACPELVEGCSAVKPFKPVNGDCVVWANRGGGKTDLAAIATLLDCVFKPNCQVRILAGSEDQAGRMYQYLTSFLRNGFEKFLDGPVRKTGCKFLNGSTVDVLTQSQASVRGQHVQKLRCDEVELFDPDVFNAAKFTTLSSNNVNAAMESISTMHKPYGLMQQIVTRNSALVARTAQNESQATKPLAESRFGETSHESRLFKWCIWETIERCTDRNCSTCPLWSDCAGKAKQSAGYLKIDDCITQMRRSSRIGWEAEMLCIKPNLENVVFDQFDPALHIRQVDYDANLPLYRSLDFGFANPFVCLWIQVDNEGVVRVIDEYIRNRATIDVHAAELKARTWHGLPARADESCVIATYCDPAGASANDVTGTSAVRELRSLGINVRFRRSGITEGIELIRRAIRDGAGQSRFIVSPKCPRLIEALTCYHYPDTPAGDELPLKDGVYDHPIDALRYFFINYLWAARTEYRTY